MGKEASSALAVEERGGSVLGATRLQGEVNRVVGSAQVATGRGVGIGCHGFGRGRHMRAVGTSRAVLELGMTTLRTTLLNEDMARSGSSWRARCGARSGRGRSTRSLRAERAGAARPARERAGEKWPAGWAKSCRPAVSMPGRSGQVRRARFPFSNYFQIFNIFQSSNFKHPKHKIPNVQKY
jgi:hypothetical protein